MRYRFERTAFRRALIGAIFIFIVIFGCKTQKNKPYTFTRFAMDTYIEYTIMAVDKEFARGVMLQAHQEIERIEHLFWTENTASEIYRFNQSKTGIETTKEVYHLVQRALDYYETTRGAFDITVKPALDLYPFKSDSPVPPTEEMINDALNYVGRWAVETAFDTAGPAWMIVKSIEKAGLDVGGIAKGYAVERAIKVLQNNHIEDALINAGGDMFCLGTKSGRPWTVGVQHPRLPGELVNVLALSNIAVATSGDYQRYFLFNGERYHHLLDTRTGKPARKAQSATVIAPTTEEADVWATALFILGPEEGIRLINGRSGVYGSLVDSSGVVYWTEGFQHFLAE